MSFVVNAPSAVVGSRARLFNRGPFQRSCVTEELKTRTEDARARRRRGHGDAPWKHRAPLYRQSARQRIRWAGETGVAACDTAGTPEPTAETTLAGPIRVGEANIPGRIPILGQPSMMKNLNAGACVRQGPYRPICTWVRTPLVTITLLHSPPKRS